MKKLIVTKYHPQNKRISPFDVADQLERYSTKKNAVIKSASVSKRNFSSHYIIFSKESSRLYKQDTSLQENIVVHKELIRFM